MPLSVHESFLMPYTCRIVVSLLAMLLPVRCKNARPTRALLLAPRLNFKYVA